MFPTTQWSLLAKASLNGETEARKALDELCRNYWAPIHAFIRGRGIHDPEAQDLTQDFMLHLWQKAFWGRADRGRGRFRSFLLGALVRFLADAADRRRAEKRGGDLEHVSLDLAEFMETASAGEATGALATAFDREWALAILEQALERTRADHTGDDRRQAFEVLKDFIPGGAQALSYEQAAAQLGISTGALKSEIHRLRQRFRAYVREEVAQTVSAPHEIDAEMAHLQQVLSDRGTEMRSAAET